MAEGLAHTIRPTRGMRFLEFRELWDYRELIYFLTWRDVKVRYKQTVLGAAWALLQPAAMMVIFALIFGRLAGIPSEGVPYPLFAYVALLPWQFFSRTITESTNSLVTDQRLITRIYFPRIIVPTTTSLAAIIDFLIASILLIGMMGYYGFSPGVNSLWILAFFLLMVMTSLGIGYWLSALNVEFRDVMYVIPFFNQFLLLLTPVVYPSSLVPGRWQIIYALNPMAGVVDGFRWSLLGVGHGPGPALAVSTGVALLLFLSGTVWFRMRERTFVDALGSGGR